MSRHHVSMWSQFTLASCANTACSGHQMHRNPSLSPAHLPYQKIAIRFTSKKLVSETVYRLLFLWVVLIWMCKIRSLWWQIQRKVIHISIWEILIFCLNLHCTCTQKSVQNQTNYSTFDSETRACDMIRPPGTCDENQKLCSIFRVACMKRKACCMINYRIFSNNRLPQ